MSPPLSGSDIRCEWGQLQRRARPNPGTAFLGYRTGQLAAHFESPDRDVRRVFLKAFTAPGLADEPMVYYHPVVHRVTDDGRRAQRREQFRHPIPAEEWLRETVPDFDLLETVPINVPDADG
jgi:hypothetical protein